MTTASHNKPNPIDHAMLMGLEVGIWFAVNFIVGAQVVQHPSLGILSWFLTFYVIYGVYRAAQHYKRFECGDTISFGAAYSYIMWLFLFASLVAALIRFAYLRWVDTSFLPHMYEQMQTFAGEFAKTNPELDMEEFGLALESFLTPIRFSVYYSMYDMILGAILGLMLAPVVKRVKARFVYPFGGKTGGKKNEDNDDNNTEN